MKESIFRKPKVIFSVLMVVLFLANLMLFILAYILPNGISWPEGFTKYYIATTYLATLLGFYICFRIFGKGVKGPSIYKHLPLSTFSNLFTIIAGLICFVFVIILIYLMLDGVASEFSSEIQSLLESFFKFLVSVICIFLCYFLFRCTIQYWVNVKAGPPDPDLVTFEFKSRFRIFSLPSSIFKVFMVALLTITLVAFLVMAAVYFITYNFPPEFLSPKLEFVLTLLFALIGFYYYYKKFGTLEQDPSFYKNLPLATFTSILIIWFGMVVFFFFFGIVFTIITLFFDTQWPNYANHFGSFFGLIAIMFILYIIYFTLRCTIQYISNVQSGRSGQQE